MPSPNFMLIRDISDRMHLRVQCCRNCIHRYLHGKVSRCLKLPKNATVQQYWLCDYWEEDTCPNTVIPD